MKKNFTLLLTLLSLACTPNKKVSETTESDWEELKKHKAAPEWFIDAKFGIYFHWGVYSVPAWGSEWYPRWMYVPDRIGWGQEIYAYHQKTYGVNFHYHDFIPKWKADNFNAKEWVDLFENAGARIIGTIAEHHDGFSLWESQVNEWNSVQMGPKLDVVKAIAGETRKRNLKFMTTFHHGFHMMFYPKPENSYTRPISKYCIVQDSCLVPSGGSLDKLYGNLNYDEANELWLGKLNEVIDEYCPDYIWMDFGQRFVNEEYLKQFLTNYFKEADKVNKEVVVNTKGSFFPTELAVVNVERATMEDITPKVWVTDFILGSSWCFNKEKRTAISPGLAIRSLADVVSKNGVMLLSAGPMADGTIPEEQIKSLNEIGEWLKLYGEAIYNTRPFITYGEGPTELKRKPEDAWNEYGAIKKGLNNLNAKDFRFTKKDKTLYVIQLGWPEKQMRVVLKSFALEAKDVAVKSISVLETNEQIDWSRTSKGLEFVSPLNKPKNAEIAFVYKIEIE